MAEIVVGLEQAVKRIRLYDSSESPVFEMVLAGDDLGKKLTDMQVYASEYIRANATLTKAAQENDTEAALAAQVDLAEIYGGMVDTMLGTGAWDVIVDWVASGSTLAVGDLVAYLSPLIRALVAELNKTLGITRGRAREKYVDVDDETDAI